ncbi:HAMP domain-containing histidine kinase [Nocardia sp. NBC_01499]|uniref:sensor histidine kinase n=1 Tax=Nocardia sp. NBC_01499 TaxID=2903597 RepID=UPI00386E4D81
MKPRRRDRQAAIPTERTVLRRTARAAAVQSALTLAAVLVLVGVVLYGADAHIQHRQIDDQLSQVAATVDDVDDPPPGMAIAIGEPNGRIAVSPHAPPPTAAAATEPTGYRNAHADGVDYRVLVVDQSGQRIAVLLDLTPWQQGRQRLLLALLAAELAGLAAAAGVAVVLSRRAIQPLADALAVQRHFVADASHELRAPLTVLHTRAQLLARRTDLDAALRTQLRGLVVDTRALADVVDDLLLAASARHEPGRRERVDLVLLCREVRESVVAEADSRGVAVDIVGRPAAELVADGVRPALRRAVFALVDNALNHEKRGGTITLRIDRAGDEVCVTVADTGAGLDPRNAEQLFRRFAHGDGHSAGVRAHGIGLALVREVVEAHDGYLTVGGAPGRGAAFTMHLPGAAAG